ncbi:unnamed protein product, partial [Ectocarpus sp. 8 AP-2014]
KQKFGELDQKARDTFHSLVPLVSAPAWNKPHSHLHAIFGEGRRNTQCYYFSRREYTALQQSGYIWYLVCVSNIKTLKKQVTWGALRAISPLVHGLVLQRNITENTFAERQAFVQRRGPRQYVEPNR